MIRRILFWLAYALGLDPRGLFCFWDGKRWRRSDPMVLARRLWSIDNFDQDESRRRTTDDAGAVKLQGFGELADAVRIAFVINDVDNGGLTDLECEQLLTRFESYLGDLKKNGSPGPTSLLFTVPSVLPDGLTSVALDSGSMSIDSSLELPA